MQISKRALFTFLSLFILIGLAFFPTKVLAACFPSGAQNEKVSLGDCLILSDGKKVSEIYARPADLVNLLVNNIFVFAGLILFGMLLYSGFQFISGSAKGAEQAKSTLTTAILGFVIMFFAFWIVRIIKLITGADILF